MKTDGSLHSLLLISNFAKLAPEELFGVTPVGKVEEMEEETFISDTLKKKMRKLIEKYFGYVSEFLFKEYKVNKFVAPLLFSSFLIFPPKIKSL